MSNDPITWNGLVFGITTLAAVVTTLWRFYSHFASRMSDIERKFFEYQLYVANNYVGNAQLREFKAELLSRFVRLEDIIQAEIRSRGSSD